MCSGITHEVKNIKEVNAPKEFKDIRKRGALEEVVEKLVVQVNNLSAEVAASTRKTGEPAGAQVRTGNESQKLVVATRTAVAELRTEIPDPNTGTSALKVDMAIMRNEISGLKESIFGLGREISGLKSEVFGLKSEVFGLKNEVAGLQKAVFELKNEVAGLRSEVFGLKRAVFDLKSAIGRLEEKINKVESAIMKISTPIEKDACETLETLLEKAGIKIKLDKFEGTYVDESGQRVSIKIDIYGANDEYCVVGESAVELGEDRVVRLLNHRSILEKYMPDALRKNIILALYGIRANDFVKKKAEDENIWLITARGEIRCLAKVLEQLKTGGGSWCVGTAQFEHRCWENGKPAGGGGG